MGEICIALLCLVELVKANENLLDFDHHRETM